MFGFFKDFLARQAKDEKFDIYLFNTLSKSKEKFIPLSKDSVKVYSCGPTVYKKQHIGNMRAFVFADTLHRMLLTNNYRLKHVINITDVGHLTDDADNGEDKLEKSAKEECKSAKEIAEHISKLFLDDLKSLNLNLSEYEFPRATQYITEQIEIIKELEKKGYTYKIEDGVYFDSSKFEKYGQLGNIDKEALKEGARIGQTKGKKHATDFALWKFSKAGEKRQQEWDSPWGRGFPGWHIECSAMSRALLGEQIDIHTGGIEHIAVHHNNEIAQSECSSGKSPFVRYWMHGQHLKVNGEKMSKSLGNVIYLSDIKERGFSPLAFRYFLLTAHYRSEINFTWEALEAASKAYSKLLDFLAKVENLGQINHSYKEKFIEKINDDLSTPAAIAIIWEMIKDDTLSPEDKKATLLYFDNTLGLDLDNQSKKQAEENTVDLPEEVKKLVKERQKAREQKDWAKSDDLREKIRSLGFEVKDSKDGQELSSL